MTGAYRILVTGWRGWPTEHGEHVENLIRSAVQRAPNHVPVVIVDGACVYGGVDDIAHATATALAAEGWHVASERHPAAEHRSPTRRNQHMVDLGAAVCLAFPGPRGGGTLDCLTRAIRANIPFRGLPWGWVEARIRSAGTGSAE